MSRTHRSKYGKWWHRWDKPGRGKEHKRRLSKARRKGAKMYVREKKAKTTARLESIVNWRNT